MYTHACTCVHACTHTQYIHACMYTHVHMYMHVCVHACVVMYSTFVFNRSRGDRGWASPHSKPGNINRAIDLMMKREGAWHLFNANFVGHNFKFFFFTQGFSQTSFSLNIKKNIEARTQLAGRRCAAAAWVLHCSRARCKIPLTAPGAIFRAMMRVSSSHRCPMGVL